ncbi:MAG: phage tail protein, partial [Pseudomonadota bacterium]
IEGVGEDGRLEKSPFIYSTAKEVDRYTAVLVRWFNPELNGQEDFELIEDEPAIAKYGYNVARIDAHGCTRRAGAIRKGRHFLFASLFQDDFIQFSVPDGGALINPAEVALVQDGDESNRTDLFGRFATINEASVQLDRAVSFNAGEVCQLVTAKNDRKVTKEFTASFTEDTQELFILYDEADRPEPNDFWLLSIVGTEEGERWRILSVSENDDEDITYTIEGIIQPLNKQPFIENFLLSDKSYGITQAITDPGPPVNLRAIEGQVSSSVGIQNQIELLWAPPQTPGVRRYEVQYKTSNEANWISDFTTANSYLIKDVTLGSFDFRVRTVSITESVSEWATAAASIIGLAGPPRDIEEFSLVAIENHMVLLKWKQSSDLDVREGGYLQINHSTADPGEWHKSVVLIEELSGVETECSTALKNGTYLIKAFDSSGKESQNAAAVTTNIDDETLKNFVRTESEAADGFPGTQTNMLVDAFGNLTLSSVGTIGAYEGRMRDIPNMGQFGVSDTPDIASTGEYECQAVELGGKYSSRIRVDVDFSIFAVSENIGDLKIRMRDIKAGYFQVDTRPSGIDALIKIRSRNDGVWGPYESFIQNGEYLGDAHQPKVTFLSKDPLLNVEVSEILTVIDIPDRNEVGEVVTSETAPVDITFKRPYFQMPIIVVSIVNQAANDRYLITNESATGFSLECLNGADARIARVLRWTASGPGRQLP